MRCEKSVIALAVTAILANATDPDAPVNRHRRRRRFGWPSRRCKRRDSTESDGCPAGELQRSRRQD